mgnify:CR=1 FL=1
MSEDNIQPDATSPAISSHLILKSKRRLIVDKINTGSRCMALAALELWLEQENPDLVAVSDPPWFLKHHDFNSFRHHWIRNPGPEESLSGIFVRSDLEFKIVNLPLQIEQSDYYDFT